MRQARTCGRVPAHGPTPSAPKQWKSDVQVKGLNPVSARSPLRAQQYKSARVSALTALAGAVPRKTAEGRQRIQHPAEIEPVIQFKSQHFNAL